MLCLAEPRPIPRRLSPILSAPPRAQLDAAAAAATDGSNSGNSDGSNGNGNDLPKGWDGSGRVGRDEVGPDGVCAYGAG